MQAQTSTQKQSQANTSDLQSETLRPTSSALTSQSQRESVVKLPVDAIYFISLRKAVVRRNKLITHLNQLGITDKFGGEAIWIESNNGNSNTINHRVDNSLKKSKNRPSLSMSEIGCFASHRMVWTEIVQKNLSKVLVLEDDARFNKSKLYNLIDHWDKLPEFDFLHLGWEYYAGYKPQTIESVDIPELPNLWNGNGMWLTHAYIITNELAQEWLDATQVQMNGLDAVTADLQSDCLAYGFKPAISYQEDKGSGMKSQIHHTG